MKIERLENGQVVLSVSKEQDYVQIKKYEPYGEPIDKATISAITEDMYVDWEVSSAYQDNIAGFLQSVRDCCQYDIYTKEVIEKYQGFIERQNEFEKIEPSNKYYDNRVVNGLDRKFDSSKLIAYDASNPQIPQKSKRFPFWIEVHTTETNYVSLHICFRADTVSLLGEHLHFILDTKSKYVILEACRVFAAMRNVFAFDSKKYAQNTFRVCLDLLKIAKAFGLIASEYVFFDTDGQNDAYLIRPIDRENGEVVVKNFPENLNIFNEYALTFERCVFMLEKENKKYDLQLSGTVGNNSVFKAINFDTCTFKVDVSVNTAFHEKISFRNSIFECPASFVATHFYGGVDFQGTMFKREADFHETLFGVEATVNEHKDEQSDNLESSFFGVTFESGVHFESAHFYHKVIFSSAKFKKEAQFYNTTFEQQASFHEATFSDYASFNHTKFFGKANFLSTIFEGKTCFTGSIFKQNACFTDVTFHDDANFDHAEFQIEKDSQGIAEFLGAHFKERAELRSIFGHDANFHRAIFDHNAYFDGVEFRQEANFSQSEFYKNAHFYEAKFKEFPIFIQTIFNGNVNFVNTELNIDFDKARGQIKSLYIERKTKYDNQTEKDKKDKEEPKEYKIANELRDSFRTIKSALIKDNNMLDASNYHRVELYYKELELECKNSGFRDFIDRIQLMCYRITSEHHTNLLLILTNVLALIVLFSVVTCGLFYCANYLPEQNNTASYASKQTYYLFALLPKYICKYFSFTDLIWGEIFVIIILCVVFVYVFISIVRFIHQINAEKLHCCFKFLCIPTLIILAIKPAIMLPIFGKLIDASLKIDFPAFTSLSVVYAIFMFLLIWSLQKTARKNTIVPN